jgi:hypothetical protein
MPPLAPTAAQAPLPPLAAEDQTQTITFAAHPPPPLPVQALSEPPAPASAGAVSSDRDLDDLALKLYDRFRSRLRSELLVDRERAGLLTDLR